MSPTTRGHSPAWMVRWTSSMGTSLISLCTHEMIHCQLLAQWRCATPVEATFWRCGPFVHLGSRSGCGVVCGLQQHRVREHREAGERCLPHHCCYLHLLLEDIERQTCYWVVPFYILLAHARRVKHGRATHVLPAVWVSAAALCSHVLLRCPKHSRC